jgi:Uma2 family endonuclease
MTTAVFARPSDSVEAAELYRLSVDQYHRIADAGILDEDDPVELLEGLLYEKHVATRPTPPGKVNVDELFRLSVDQYDAMGRAGILTTDDRVELLEGILVRKMTIYPPHTGAVRRCRTNVEARLPSGWRYRSEQPAILPDGEPEPDGVIARGTPDDDDRFHPPAADIVLVIEVADSTLVRDRGPKLRTYARAGIPVYWIINLIDRQVEVHTDPDPAAPEPTYRRREVYVGDAAVPLALPGGPAMSFPVAALLPPA